MKGAGYRLNERSAPEPASSLGVIAWTLGFAHHLSMRRGGGAARADRKFARAERVKQAEFLRNGPGGQESAQGSFFFETRLPGRVHGLQFQPVRARVLYQRRGGRQCRVGQVRTEHSPEGSSVPQEAPKRNVGGGGAGTKFFHWPYPLAGPRTPHHLIRAFRHGPPWQPLPPPSVRDTSHCPRATGSFRQPSAAAHQKPRSVSAGLPTRSSPPRSVESAAP